MKYNHEQNISKYYVPEQIDFNNKVLKIQNVFVKITELNGMLI